MLTPEQLAKVDEIPFHQITLKRLCEQLQVERDIIIDAVLDGELQGDRRPAVPIEELQLRSNIRLERALTKLCGLVLLRG